MADPLFSIITVCLNAGPKLLHTVSSVLEQKCEDYELIVKDGGSYDHSLDALPAAPRLRIICELDKGIFDAMNQAAQASVGKYLLFLNAGDLLPDSGVLRTVAACISVPPSPPILYGDYYNRELRHTIRYPERLTPFYLYRRYVCHQSQVIRRDVFEALHGLNPDFNKIADVEFLVRAMIANRYEARHCSVVLSDYEGGGFTEMKENRRMVRWEARYIRRRYFGSRFYVYEALRIMTLPELRARLIKMAKDSCILSWYNKLADMFR